MTNPFRPVDPENKFVPRAQAFNNMMEGAEFAKNHQVGTNSPNTPLRRQSHQLRLKVINDTVGDIVPYGVIGIGNWAGSNASATEINDTLLNSPHVFWGDKVDPTHWDGNFAVYRGGCKSGDVGRAVYKGVIGTIVDRPDATAYHYPFCDLGHRIDDAGTLSSQYLVQKPSGRGRILWMSPEAISGTNHWAIVDLDSYQAMRFSAEITGNHLIGVKGTTGSTIPYRWKYDFQQLWNIGSEGEGQVGSNSFTANEYDKNYKWHTGHGHSSIAHAGASEKAGDHYFALNRFESSLANQIDMSGNQTGYAKMEACQIQGTPEACPPAWALAPTLVPTLDGTVVEITAGRAATGKAMWTFDAMTPMQYEVQAT